MGSGKRLRIRIAAAVAAPACAALLAPAGASGAGIAVDTTTDESSNNTTCSLREALTSANSNSNAHEDDCVAGDGGATTDTISLGAGTHTLAGTAGEDANAGGDLDVTGGGPVIFTGAPIDASDKPVSVIDGGDNDRLFDLILNGGEQVDVELLALELRNGRVTGSEDGGAVRVGDPDARLVIDTVIASGNDAGDYGGAVYYPDGVAASRFRVEQSEFSGNTAGDEGGALWLDLIENFGNNPTIDNSAFVGNSAAQMGGAIYLGTRAVDAIFLEVTNTTISGNSATLGGGALAFALSETGNARFDYSTIANNSTATAGQGGAILTAAAVPEEQFVLLDSSIIAGNTAAGAASNCAGPGNIQGGYSIESTNSCGLLLATSKVNTDPLIAPLATNPGGELTTRTHGLYDTSPAVNMAPLAQCTGGFPVTTIDQRYVGRPIGGGCDVGAHEGTVGPAPANPAPPATPATPAKKCKKKKKKSKSAAAAKKKKKGCKKKKKK